MPSLHTDPRDADTAIVASGFASLGDGPFYHGSVNTGDGDAALIFASGLTPSTAQIMPAKMLGNVPACWLNLTVSMPSCSDCKNRSNKKQEGSGDIQLDTGLDE